MNQFSFLSFSAGNWFHSFLSCFNNSYENIQLINAVGAMTFGITAVCTFANI